MDFDKFLEKDMVDFLEEQAAKLVEKAEGMREEESDLFEITQDYSTELTKALKDGDLKKAQKIFEDVKNKYMKSPENSLSRKRLYVIMEEVYEKIKDYESQEKGKKSLFETIREYEQKGLFNRPEILEKKEASAIGLVLSTLELKEKELEKLTSKQPFSMTELKEAIEIYRGFKQLVKKIPNKYDKIKSNSYDSALSWFYTLKKLKEQLGLNDVTLKEEAAEQEQEKTVERNLNEIRRLKEAIIDSHKKISNFIRKRQLTQSIYEYKHLKQLCDEFPNEMEHEKTALLADAISLYDSIKKLKSDFVKNKISQVNEEQHKAQEDLLRKSDENKRIEDENKIKNKIMMDEKTSKMRADIMQGLESVKELLSQKRTAEAISTYKLLRKMFQEYPDVDVNSKNELYSKIMAAHKDIRLLEEDLKRKTPTFDMKIIEHLQKLIALANKLLDAGKIDVATNGVMEIKHRIEMLPKEAFDEKYSLSKAISVLEHKILFVKNTQNMQKQNMQNALPMTM